MDFPFANGVVKAIESGLLDRPKYAKLAKTDRVDFPSVLSGFGYGSGENDLESLIRSELTELKRRIEEITPDPQATSLFFLPNDAINLKILWKEKRFGIPRPEQLSVLGAFAPEIWVQAVVADDLSGLPSWILPLWEEVARLARSAYSSRTLSAGIDSAIFRFVFRSVKGLPWVALKSYFRQYADLHNVITLVRARALRWEWTPLSEMILPGGLLSEELLIEAWNQSDWDLFARVFRDVYEEKITRALKRYGEIRDLDALEGALDQLLLDLSGEYRHDPFGIGPIVYYYLKKTAEAKNLRLLYTEGSAGMAKLLE